MSDLHDTDIILWSERQATLLRRVAEGERLNDVDWPHVIEEIADVGIAELNAVRGLLRQAMIHLLKIHLSPEDQARSHWHRELDAFIDSALDRYVPSMKQRIDVQPIWERAKQRIARHFPDHPGTAALPRVCPWTPDDLLTHEHDVLLAMLPDSPSPPNSA